MNNTEIILENIKNRRTIKPESCTNASIPDEDVWKILESANWAPTHGYTEPWRFVVFTGESKHVFSKAHAEMYKKAVSPENFKQVAFDKLINRAKHTSHIIVYVNKRGMNPKIPEFEEIQSTSMAIQNVALTAAAMGYAGYIHSGAQTFSAEMKAYLGFGEKDKVMGVFYLGVPNAEERAQGRRITLIKDKVQWNS